MNTPTEESGRCICRMYFSIHAVSGDAMVVLGWGQLEDMLGRKPQLSELMEVLNGQTPNAPWRLFGVNPEAVAFKVDSEVRIKATVDEKGSPYIDLDFTALENKGPLH